MLNAAILPELEADLPTRHLDDGRSVEDALTLERLQLRAVPAHLPATCRVVARVVDKFGDERVAKVTYSVPIRHAYRPVWVKLYHDRVAMALRAEVVARPGRRTTEPFLPSMRALSLERRGRDLVNSPMCSLRSSFRMKDANPES